MVFQRPERRRNIYPYHVPPNHIVPYQRNVNKRQNNFPTFLQRLFKPTNTQYGPKQSLSFGGITNVLNSIQQLLHVIETTSPMVRQYGPMLKNLPTMIKMLKAFHTMDEANLDEETSDIEYETETIENSVEIENEIDTVEDSEETVDQDNHESKHRASKNKTGESIPKLFI